MHVYVCMIYYNKFQCNVFHIYKLIAMDVYQYHSMMLRYDVFQNSGVHIALQAALEEFLVFGIEFLEAVDGALSRSFEYTDHLSLGGPTRQCQSLQSGCHITLKIVVCTSVTCNHKNKRKGGDGGSGKKKHGAGIQIRILLCAYVHLTSP